MSISKQIFFKNPNPQANSATPTNSAAFSTSKDEELGGFLSSLELTELRSIFEKHRVTLKKLRLLSESDLKELGIPVADIRLIQFELPKFKVSDSLFLQSIIVIRVSS